MAKSNSNDIYFWSIVIGAVAGIITRDWPVGVLTSIALMLTLIERRKRSRQ